MTANTRNAAFASIAVCLATMTGCGDDFAPYNLVSEPRLLAIRAEPPVAGPSQVVTLDTLVHAPGITPAHDWSWCPVAAGSANDYRCAVSESDFRTLVDTVLGPQAAAAMPSYALGTADVASFPSFIPPGGLEALCQAALTFGVPKGASVPDCGFGWEVSVTLDMQLGDSSVRGVKLLRLSDGATTNNNPKLSSLKLGDENVPLTLFGTRHRLKVLLAQDASEMLAQGRHESLVLTWFITAGTTERMRTRYDEGKTTFEDLLTNEWDLTDSVDQGGDPRVFVVLRDERGGVDWLTLDARALLSTSSVSSP